MAQDLFEALGLQAGPVDLFGPTAVRQGPENKRNAFDNFMHHLPLVDKVDAALGASGLAPDESSVVKAGNWGERYRGTLKNLRNENEAFETENPKQAMGAEAAALIAPLAVSGPAAAAEQTLGKAAWTGAKSGMKWGGAYGFSGTDDEDLGETAIATGLGTGAGGLTGGALPIGLGIARVPFRAAGRARSVFGKEGQEVTAGRILNEAQTGANAFEHAPLPGMRLSLGQSSGDDGLLWLERSVKDATPEGATIFGESLAKNNEAIKTGIKQLGDETGDAGAGMRSALVKRQPEASAQDQVLDLARQHLGGENFHGTVAQLNSSMKASSAPLYQKAMAGGSIAPLMDQLRNELTIATGAKGQIARQIREIEKNNPGALAARGAAGADVRTKYMDLQTQLKAAESDRQATLEMFKHAQADKADGTPGAVWSPRLSQFLSDPILKSGISKGVQIQRLEALAEGKKFDPTELGITGVDEAGQSIVSKVPNMRLLDAGKKGLDAIVEGYRNPITGKLVLDQYGNAVNKVRASYVSELDRLNPEYKAARQSWSGPSQSLDAMHAGRSIFSPDVEMTTQRIAGLSPSDMKYYQSGVMRAIDDLANDSANGASSLNSMLAKPNVQQKLTAAFGSAENFQKFRQQSAAILNPQTDLGKALAKDRAGEFTLPTSGIAEQFIRTGKGAPEAFNSYMGAIGTKNPKTGKVEYDADGLKAVQDAFTQKFLKQVTNAGVDAKGEQLVSPAKMTQFLDDHAHVINSPAFTPEQRALVQRIAQATKMASRTANAKPAGGSDTFPKLQGDKFIDALIGPGAAKLLHVGGAAAGATAGYLTHGATEAVIGAIGGERAGSLIAKLYEKPREEVVSIITQAMNNPQMAKALMTKASNSNAKLLAPPTRAKLFGTMGAQVSAPLVNAAMAPQ